MAIRVRALSEALTSALNERRADVNLFELDRRSDIVSARSPLSFQYFPESISDTKGVNQQNKEIAGASLPLYQWVSSGERLISFTASFTADVDVTSNPDARQGALRRRNPDIRSALLWLRRFLMPTYSQSRTFPPAKLRLHIPNSGIGLIGGGRSAADVSDDAIYCIMTQCEITMENYFPNGVPKAAEVQLAFAQTAQIGGGRVFFPSVSPDVDDLVYQGGRGRGAAEVFAYNIRPRAAR